MGTIPAIAILGSLAIVAMLLAGFRTSPAKSLQQRQKIAEGKPLANPRLTASEVE